MNFLRLDEHKRANRVHMNFNRSLQEIHTARIVLKRRYLQDGSVQTIF